MRVRVCVCRQYIVKIEVFWAMFIEAIINERTVLLTRSYLTWEDST